MTGGLSKASNNCQVRISKVYFLNYQLHSLKHPSAQNPSSPTTEWVDCPRSIFSQKLLFNLKDIYIIEQKIEDTQLN